MNLCNLKPYCYLNVKIKVFKNWKIFKKLDAMKSKESPRNVLIPYYLMIGVS